MILNLGLESTRLDESKTYETENSNILCEITSTTTCSIIVKIIEPNNRKISQTQSK